MIHHTIVDHVFFALLLAIPLVEWKWTWPRYLAKLACGTSTARRGHYRNLIVGEWIPTLILLAFWAIAGRKLADLHLTGAIRLRLGLGLLYIVALVCMLVWQRRALLARPDRRARVRKALRFGEPLLPHTENERRAFWIGHSGMLRGDLLSRFSHLVSVRLGGTDSRGLACLTDLRLRPCVSRRRAGAQNSVHRVHLCDRRQSDGLAVAGNAAPRRS